MVQNLSQLLSLFNGGHLKGREPIERVGERHLILGEEAFQFMGAKHAILGAIQLFETFFLEKYMCAKSVTIHKERRLHATFSHITQTYFTS